MRLRLVATDTQSAVLVPGQAVTSEGGQYELQMCHDGNLALIEIPANSRVVWETGTRFRPTGRYSILLSSPTETLWYTTASLMVAPPFPCGSPELTRQTDRVIISSYRTVLLLNFARACRQRDPSFGHRSPPGRKVTVCFLC